MNTNKCIVAWEEDVTYILPSAPAEFMAFWQDKLDKVPGEFKDTAEIEVSADSFYDSISIACVVSYTRPESLSEEEARKKDELAGAKRAVDRELARLRELKAKYPNA